jgi:hypothetical protein
MALGQLSEMENEARLPSLRTEAGSRATSSEAGRRSLLDSKAGKLRSAGRNNIEALDEPVANSSISVSEPSPQATRVAAMSRLQYDKKERR